MRHRVHTFKVGRTSSHRRAMLANMVSSLIEHGQITTSLVKAKEIPAGECLVFEGFMDFLSAETLQVTGNADCLVLNSVANVGKATELLEGYGRIGWTADACRTHQVLRGTCRRPFHPL